MSLRLNLNSPCPGAFIPIDIVITGLDPVIHLFERTLTKMMDARIKSGHDECVWRDRFQGAVIVRLDPTRFTHLFGVSSREAWL